MQNPLNTADADVTVNPNSTVSTCGELPITKAGLFIYDKTPSGPADHRTRMLIGLSDRYGPDIYPTLPKGSIDEGETPLEAGRREVMEETGVDIRRLLGPKRYEALMQGEEVVNYKSHGYRGVTVKSAKPQPTVDHTYTSRFGRPHRVVFYEIEVEGIDQLKGAMKGYKNGKPTAWRSSGAMARSEGLPSFEDCLTIMRSGVVPSGKQAWADSKKDTVLFESPALPMLEKKYGISVQSIEDYTHLCSTIAGGDHRTLLLPQMALFKKHLQKKHLISDDAHPLKFDITDRPLTYYQEKADIQVAGDILRKSHSLMHSSALFAGSMWGGYAGKPGQPRTEDEKIDTAQVTALTEFISRVAPMEVAAAAMGRPNLRQKLGKEAPLLDVHMLRVIERKVPQDGWAERLRSEPAKDRNR